MLNLEMQAKAHARGGFKDGEDVGFLPAASLTAALFGEM
jgi:hypothetical protein